MAKRPSLRTAPAVATLLRLKANAETRFKLALAALFSATACIACGRTVTEPRRATSTPPHALAPQPTLAAAPTLALAPLPAPSALPPPAPAPPLPPEPPRLRAPFAMQELPVADFADAVISLPLGATTKRPVMVAVHGFRGRADWTCRIARHLVENHAFVLCPQGKPAPAVATDGDWSRFTFASPQLLQKEIDAGLAALARAYPDFVDDSRLFYYGHSLGASYAVTMVQRDPSRWSRVVMSEGGWGGWWPTPKARAAGQRVLFACGTPECLAGANASARALAKGKIAAKVAYAEGGGHHSFGPIVDAMESEVPWLMDGDARF